MVLVYSRKESVRLAGTRTSRNKLQVLGQILLFLMHISSIRIMWFPSEKPLASLFVASHPRFCLLRCMVRVGIRPHIRSRKAVKLHIELSWCTPVHVITTLVRSLPLIDLRGVVVLVLKHLAYCFGIRLPARWCHTFLNWRNDLFNSFLGLAILMGHHLLLLICWVCRDRSLGLNGGLVLWAGSSFVVRVSDSSC